MVLWMFFFSKKGQIFELQLSLTTPVWLTAVTPTDRPKSVRNCCVIEVFGGVFVCCYDALDFSVGIRAFVLGLSQISSFFSSTKQYASSYPSNILHRAVCNHSHKEMCSSSNLFQEVVQDIRSIIMTLNSGESKVLFT